VSLGVGPGVVRRASLGGADILRFASRAVIVKSFDINILEAI
jgi:hypothetical protein